MSGFDKDRHSRMPASSVNQPMKKGGAGVGNWGSVTDPAALYDPVGYGGPHHVVTAPVAYQTVPAQYVAAQPLEVSISDAQHFPPLGGSVAMPTHAPMPVQWGPAVVQAAPVPISVQQQLEAQNRPGVVYDASHPRHVFAKRPSVAQTVVSTEAAPQAIDWSQMGTQAIQQTMLHVAANPAVLGPSPSMPVYPATPLTVLQSTPTPVQQAYALQPTHIQQAYTTKPQFTKNPKLTQARGR